MDCHGADAPRNDGAGVGYSVLDMVRAFELETLERWLQSGNSRFSALWLDWQDILTHGKWRKVLGRTRRAQELRQASPLVTVLPTETRQRILNEVRDLKKGVALGDVTNEAAA